MVSWLLMLIPVQFERSTRWGIQLMVSVMQTCNMRKKMKTTVIIAFISIKQYANVPSHGIQHSAKKHAVLRPEVCVCVVFSLSSWSDFTSCWYITFHFHFDIHRIMCTKNIYAHRITIRLFNRSKTSSNKEQQFKESFMWKPVTNIISFFYEVLSTSRYFAANIVCIWRKIPRMIKKKL